MRYRDNILYYFDIIKTAIEFKDIRAEEQIGIDTISSYKVDAKSFVKWARKKYDLPNELRIQIIENKTLWADGFNYAVLEQGFPKHPGQKNKSHKEDLLYIANKARLALVNKEIVKKYTKKPGNKEKISAWIEENFPNIAWNKTKLESVSIIVNNGYRPGNN